MAEAKTPEQLPSPVWMNPNVGSRRIWPRSAVDSRVAGRYHSRLVGGLGVPEQWFVVFGKM